MLLLEAPVQWPMPGLPRAVVAELALVGATIQESIREEMLALLHLSALASPLATWAAAVVVPAYSGSSEGLRTLLPATVVS